MESATKNFTEETEKRSDRLLTGPDDSSLVMAHLVRWFSFIYLLNIFNVPWQSVRIPKANLSKCSLSVSTNIHCNCFFDSPNNCCDFLRMQIHPNPSTGNKKNGKPGDQNVCLQCGHWSVAQRVDVYAGNRFLILLKSNVAIENPLQMVDWWILHFILDHDFNWPWNI